MSGCLYQFVCLLLTIQCGMFKTAIGYQSEQMRSLLSDELESVAGSQVFLDESLTKKTLKMATCVLCVPILDVNVNVNQV